MRLECLRFELMDEALQVGRAGWMFLSLKHHGHGRGFAHVAWMASSWRERIRRGERRMAGSAFGEVEALDERDGRQQEELLRGSGSAEASTRT